MQSITIIAKATLGQCYTPQRLACYIKQYGLKSKVVKQSSRALKRGLLHTIITGTYGNASNWQAACRIATIKRRYKALNNFCIHFLHYG